MAALDAVPPRLAIAGIGTDVGKTLVSAILCAGLECDYWKPVQAGLVPETDTQYVQRITGLDTSHFHPEAYRLQTPASPHHAAAVDGVTIALERLTPPETARPLLMELAGGILVPLGGGLFNVDLLVHWQAPVLLVVRTYLGSINHSLLTLEVLRQRGIALAGIVLSDGGYPSSEEPILAAAGAAPLLGRVPHLAEIDGRVLREVFEREFFWGRGR